MVKSETGKHPNPRLIGLSRAGYRALEKNRLDEAGRYFDQMLEIDPRNSYALVGSGELARKQRNLPRALEHYEACLRNEPGNHFALKAAAECSWEMEKYDRSVELWEAFVRVKGPDAMALSHIADGWRKLGDQEKSQSAYHQALAMEPDNRYALNGLGNLLYDQGRNEEAAECWERLVARDRTNVKALTALGNCRRKLRDFNRALEHFRTAAALEKDNFYALYGIADCLRGMGEHERSLEALKALLALSPDNKIILTRAGDACRRIGELDEAESYYRKALDSGFDLYAEIGMSSLQMIQGDIDGAVQRLQALRKREPLNAPCGAGACELLHRLRGSRERTGAHGGVPGSGRRVHSDAGWRRQVTKGSRVCLPCVSSLHCRRGWLSLLGRSHAANLLGRRTNGKSSPNPAKVQLYRGESRDAHWPGRPWRCQGGFG